MKRRLANKACTISVALGAVLELEEKAKRWNFSPSLRWSSPSASQVRFPCTDAAACRNINDEAPDGSRQPAAGDESLRMVFYVSCWGPD